MEAPKSQYQHFIPQFLLRNFAHPFVCPDTPPRSKRCHKRHHERHKYPGDAMVFCLDMSSSEKLSLQEAPVKRICGQQNMYTSMVATAFSSQQRTVEEAFSRLEQKVSDQCRLIIKAHASGKETVRLNRADKDVLRKFAFLMRLRGHQFHQRYARSIEDYQEDDQKLLRNYLFKANLQSPIDAWLKSMACIIDLEMDPQNTWKERIRQTAYSPIAESFVQSIEDMYMSIVTPRSPGEHFVLTDNCYNVAEGPTVYYKDAGTGEVFNFGFNFHYFFPITQDLMLVLRHCYLPQSLHDGKFAHCHFLLKMLRLSDPDTHRFSLFEYLPVGKAQAEYVNSSKILAALEASGGGISAGDQQQYYHRNDQFHFRISHISSDHVRKINGLLIDHAFHGSRIVYTKEAVFLNLLEWYLAEPCEVGKHIGGEYGSQHRRYIELLSQFVAGKRGREVETNVEFHGTRQAPPSLQSDERLRSLKFGDPKTRVGAAERVEYVMTFELLGGVNLVSDTAEAVLMFKCWRMALLRYQRNADYLFWSYKKFPPAVFWLFMKRLRHWNSLDLCDDGDMGHDDADVRQADWGGPEDRSASRLHKVGGSIMVDQMHKDFSEFYEDLVDRLSRSNAKYRAYQRAYIVAQLDKARGTTTKTTTTGTSKGSLHKKKSRKCLVAVRSMRRRGKYPNATQRASPPPYFTRRELAFIACILTLFLLLTICVLYAACRLFDMLMWAIVSLAMKLVNM